MTWSTLPAPGNPSQRDRRMVGRPACHPAGSDWDDPSPPSERPLAGRDAGVAARRGLKVAVGLLGLLAAAGLLVSASQLLGDPSGRSGLGNAIVPLGPTAQPSVSVLALSSLGVPSEQPLISPPVQSRPQMDDPTSSVRATVIRVVDGDTIHARIDGLDETIRIIGLDSPESHAPGTPVECFALEATAAAKSLLSPGDDIVLQSDPTQDGRDRYRSSLGSRDPRRRRPVR